MFTNSFAPTRQALAWTITTLMVASLAAATASAQQQPKAAATQPARVQTPKALLPAPPTATQPSRIRPPVRRTPTSAPAAKNKGGCGAKGVKPTPSPDGPQPRWVCDKPLVTAEPVWKGKKIEFTFEVRNEGEGPLQILAKGG